MSKLTTEELNVLRERYSKYNQMCDLYNENEEFRNFVDKSSRQYGFHKDICLLHKTVQDVGEYYLKKKEHENDICPCGRGTDDLPDDKSC